MTRSTRSDLTSTPSKLNPAIAAEKAATYRQVAVTVPSCSTCADWLRSVVLLRVSFATVTIPYVLFPHRTRPCVARHSRPPPTLTVSP